MEVEGSGRQMEGLTSSSGTYMEYGRTTKHSPARDWPAPTRLRRRRL